MYYTGGSLLIKTDMNVSYFPLFISHYPKRGWHMQNYLYIFGQKVSNYCINEEKKDYTRENYSLNAYYTDSLPHEMYAVCCADLI